MNLALGQKGKLILKIMMIIAVLGGLGLAVFALRTFSSIPMERLNLLERDSQRNSEQDITLGQLESGSHPEVESVKSFLLFTETNITFRDWLVANSSSGKIEEKNNSLEILQNISMPKLAANECQQVYCYQRRMSFESIPSVFWKGLIGIEDVRFLEHQGVDFRSIARAIITDIKAMRLVQGGSTITQQLVKNLFLTNEKSFQRKIQEILVSFYIEAKFPKENILEAYFNEVFFGSFEGIRVKGLFAASIFYFQKKPQELNSYEASILVSLLKGPSYYHPINHQERLKKRVSVVYEKLREMNLFYGSNEVLWSEKDWERWSEDLKKITERGMKHALWMTIGLGQKLINEFDAFVLVDQMRQMQKNIQTSYPETDFGIKILIRDLSPNRRYKSNELMLYSKYERSWQEAMTKEKHHIGSTFKPIIFHVLDQNNVNLQELVSTDELTMKLVSGSWSPRETIKNYPSELTLAQALQLSLNRPIVRAVQSFGFEKMQKDLLRFVPDLKTPLSEYPAQLLGSVELSLDQILDMYKKFVDEQCGDDKYNVFGLLSDPQKTTIRRQVSEGFSEIPFFGKTGTSNDGLDNLFVFYDGKHLGVIWVGVEGKRAESSVRLFGSTTSFELFQRFSMQRGSRFPELNCHPSRENHDEE